MKMLKNRNKNSIPWAFAVLAGAVSFLSSAAIPAAVIVISLVVLSRIAPAGEREQRTDSADG